MEIKQIIVFMTNQAIKVIDVIEGPTRNYRRNRSNLLQKKSRRFYTCRVSGNISLNDCIQNMSNVNNKFISRNFHLDSKEQYHKNKSEVYETDYDDEVDDIFLTRMEDLCSIMDDLAFESNNFGGCKIISRDLNKYCNTVNIPAHIAIEISRLPESAVPDFCAANEILPEVASEITARLLVTPSPSSIYYCGHCDGLAHCQTFWILIAAGHTECFHCYNAGAN